MVQIPKDILNYSPRGKTERVILGDAGAIPEAGTGSNYQIVGRTRNMIIHFYTHNFIKDQFGINFIILRRIYGPVQENGEWRVMLMMNSTRYTDRYTS